MKYDLNNMFIYMPTNFKKVHDRTAQEYMALKDKIAAAEKKRRERLAAKKMAETKKAMEEIFSKNDGVDAFQIKGKGLILVVPKTGDEIRQGGCGSMLRQNTNALGIIFPNSYDNTVPLAENETMHIGYVLNENQELSEPGVCTAVLWDFCGLLCSTNLMCNFRIWG